MQREQSVNHKYGRDITDEVNQELHQFGEYLTDFFDNILRDAMGKVYVM
jgi:hypothetical protein